MSDKKTEIEKQIIVKPAKSYIIILLIVVSTLLGIFCFVGAVSCFFAGNYLDGIYYTSLSFALVMSVLCHQKLQNFINKHVDPVVIRKF